MINSFDVQPYILAYSERHFFIWAIDSCAMLLQVNFDILLINHRNNKAFITANLLSLSA